MFVGRKAGSNNNDMEDIDSDTIRINNNKPRMDRSKVTIVLPPPPPPPSSTTTSSTTTTLPDTSQQEIIQQEVDLQELYKFLQDQREFVQSERLSIQLKTRQILHEEMKVALQDCHSKGITKFADWYFSYLTTYKLLMRAIKTAIQSSKIVSKKRNNKEEDGETTIHDAVQHDLQRLICEKYQVLVLRPSLTDPKVHRAVVKTLQQLLLLKSSTNEEEQEEDAPGGGSDSYIATIQTKIDESIRQFIVENQQQDSSSSSPSAITTVAPTTTTTTTNRTTTTMIPPDAVVLDLDWSAQLQKAQYIPLEYEKTPKGLSVALVVGGGGTVAAAASKSVGAAASAGTAVAAKSAGVTAAIKSLSAKLASPFAAKAVGTTIGGKAATAAGAGAAAAGSAGAGATASTAAGAAVAGGPIGAVIGGALVGAAVDMTLNKGIELIQRDNFVNDVTEALYATQLEWEERILPELYRTIDECWFQPIDESLQKQQALIVDQIKKNNKKRTTTVAPSSNATGT